MTKQYARLLRLLIVFSLLCLNMPLLNVPAALAQEDSDEAQSAAGDSIAVGSKNFTEQLILGQMLVLLLEDAGYSVVDRTGTGGTDVVREALEAGDIDLYPEYTGTTLSIHHGLPSNALPTEPDRVYELARSLDAADGLVALPPAPFNNTYTLMVRQELVDEGVETLEELADYMTTAETALTLCVDSEFFSRPQDGLQDLERQYGFTFDDENIVLTDLDQAYESLREGECDVAEGFTTDGRIPAYGFATLEDSLGFFPVYNPGPVVRAEVIEANPELIDVLTSYGSYLDDETMAQLNAQVSLGPDGVASSGDELSPQDAARRFLLEIGLLRPDAIRVGAQETTGQQLLAQMLVLLLEDAGYEASAQMNVQSTDAIRQALLTEEIDLYPTYVATDLVVHHGIPMQALPSSADRAHALAQSLDATITGVALLSRSPLDNHAVLLAGPELVAQGITSLEGLAVNASDDAPLVLCLPPQLNDNLAVDLAALAERYALDPAALAAQTLEGNLFEALSSGACDMAVGEATDGYLALNPAAGLADPAEFFPANHLALAMRQSSLVELPSLVTLLDDFVQSLDNQTIRQLNAQIAYGPDGEPGSGDEREATDVARIYLEETQQISPAQVVDATATPTGTLPLTSTTTTTDVEATVPNSEDSTGEDSDGEDSDGEDSDGEDSNDGNSTSTDSPSESAEPPQPTDGEAAIQSLRAPLEQELITARNALAAQIGTAGDAPTIRIASSSEASHALYGELVSLLLANVGFDVSAQFGLGDAAALREALRADEIDLYIESTGVGLSLFYGLPNFALPREREVAYGLIRRLDAPKGIAWLPPSRADSSYALLIGPLLREQLGLETLDDLAAYTNANDSPLTLCINDSFFNTYNDSSPGGLFAIQETYNFQLPAERIRILPRPELYASYAAGECDVLGTSRLDGQIDSAGLHVLADTSSAIPAFSLSPVAQREVMVAYPALSNLLETLSSYLTSESLRQLDVTVVVGPDGEPDSGDELTPRSAARALLCSDNLIESCGDSSIDSP